MANSLDSLLHSLLLRKNLRILGRNHQFLPLNAKNSLLNSLQQGIGISPKALSRAHFGQGLELAPQITTWFRFPPK
jgi:hypothetical protein